MDRLPPLDAPDPRTAPRSESVPDPVHVMLDFWTALYQAIDD